MKRNLQVKMEKRRVFKGSWEQSFSGDEEADTEPALNKAMLLSITDTEYLSMLNDDSLCDVSIIPDNSRTEYNSYSFESTESTSYLSMLNRYAKKNCAESHEDAFADRSFDCFNDRENKKNDEKNSESPKNVPLCILLRNMIDKALGKSTYECKQLENVHIYNNENDSTCKSNSNAIFTQSSTDRQGIINWNLFENVEDRQDYEKFSEEVERRNVIWQNLPELKDALERSSFDNVTSSFSTSSELSSVFTTKIFSEERLITIFEATNESASMICPPDWSADCLVRMTRSIEKRYQREYN